jgi:DivIVA domain-containing protein
MNPQRVRSAEFKTVRKGADQDEVRVFLNDVADELERAQNQATAMEARARAAVARLQEVTESDAAAPKVEASAEEAETISRTLLLAQRTADSTIADSQSEAARIVAQARNEAAATLDSTREMSAQLIAEARIEARRTAEAEHQSIMSEVEALKARRDFLESDVHHLETFLVDQRSRVREAATSLLELTERVPGGLGDVRSPLLSASDDDTGEIVVDEQTELLIVTGAAVDGVDGADDPIADNLIADVPVADDEIADDEIAAIVVADEVESAPAVDLNTDPWSSDDPTEAIPVFGAEVDDKPTDSDDFTFSFDDERR